MYAMKGDKMSAEDLVLCIILAFPGITVEDQLFCVLGIDTASRAIIKGLEKSHKEVITLLPNTC